VTLADVAARAGVSVATASVAITGRPSGNCRVSSAVAEKIRQAAAQLNYRPNLQARNLSTRRTHTIAVLVKRAAWHNAISYIAPVQAVLRTRGYTEMLMLQPDNNVDSERENLELCVQRQVEGILTFPLIDLNGRTNLEHYQRVQRDEGMPILQLGVRLPEFDAPSIVTDEVGGFAKAVTLLHAMGHERIAHLSVAGYDDASSLNPFVIAHQRYLGYHQTMSELGLREQVFALPERINNVNMLFDQALALAKEIAAAAPRPTAIVAFSDYSAAGLIAGFKQLGVKVPDDISIIGVGDQLFSQMLDPKLTVLMPPFEQQAELAANMILKMIEGGSVESRKVMPALLMRDSVQEVRR
jgi:DNA-binding LacI/PurR family transcriptional regulator